MHTCQLFRYTCIVVVALFVMGCEFSKSSGTVLSDANMRFVRLRATLLDGMGKPIENVEWNTKGDFRRITEGPQWILVKEDGTNTSLMMFRYLLIPGAPWMQWDRSIYIAARAGSDVQKIGHEEFHPLKVQGQKEEELWMWNTIYTNGKYVGVDRDKIFECDAVERSKQIGWLALRNLTLETGETVRIFMTKGMETDAMWEGDAGDTAYREGKAGQGTPIGKLQFRPVKTDDGKETLILMFRPLSENTTWTGVKNGKVIKSK